MKEAIKSDLISIIETFGFELKTEYFKELFADLLAKEEDHKQFKLLETFSIIPTWHLKLYYGSIFVCFFEANIQVIVFDSEFLGEKYFWQFTYDFVGKIQIIKDICFAIERYRFKSSLAKNEISQDFLNILEKKIIPLLKSKERTNFKKVLDKHEAESIDKILLEDYFLIIYSYLNKDWDIPFITGQESESKYFKILLKQR